MRVLVIGSGGREHALAWKLRQSKKVSRVFIAPGNGGTSLEGENVPIAEKDIASLVNFAKEKAIDLTLPGPEVPLTLGIVDAFAKAGLNCFGPDMWCARLEGSKSFAKAVMQKSGVPTASYGVFDNYDAALAFVKKHGTPVVIKADGLAAGKGVTVAKSEEEAVQALGLTMKEGIFGAAGQSVIIEEFLEGEEVSLLCFCDGKNALPLPSAQDHKAAFDDDKGPNTGGMGAYSPAPVLVDSELEHMTDIAIRPVLREMASQGHPFRGILYAGLMLTSNGPRILEYNVRFGDPECQALIMRLNSDLPDILQACLEGRLSEIKLDISPMASLGVVLTAAGYPGSYASGMEISGLTEAEEAWSGNGDGDGAEESTLVKVFVAGAKRDEGILKASGGRVLCVTAMGQDLSRARDRAYKAISLIRMNNGRYRSDIGAKGLRRI